MSLASILTEMLLQLFNDILDTFGFFPLLTIFIFTCYVIYAWDKANTVYQRIKKDSLLATPEEKLITLKIYWKQRQYVAQLMIILLLMLIFFYIWSLNPKLS